MSQKPLVAIVNIVLLFAQAAFTNAADPSRTWPKIKLLNPKEVKLSGAIGDSLDRGVKRLAKPPYSLEWLRSDVSFETNRIFTNYSGDASGRFLELVALTRSEDHPAPAAFRPLMETVSKYQKADGHFGKEHDYSKPLKQNTTPITMLWGNARMLVGLVTCAEELHDPKLLEAAKRLGDFYVNSNKHLTSPAREAEYRSSGTYGDSYTCCYFPAMEGLNLLYLATKDERYLKQAKRMAEWFFKFDTLPTDHSHGNLCDWRSIVQLYEITGEKRYLDLACAKWDAAMNGGYIWPIGGVGEHFYVSFKGDEGCSESDLLRFHLDLWRMTGEVRYLDMAERLLLNQYAANQCPNGGYGMRLYDNDATGPIATHNPVEEWPFCCNFHGPLGLYFLKGYLAASSDQGIFVNFPLDFTAPVKAGGRDWRIAVQSNPRYSVGEADLEVELVPQGQTDATHTTLWLRVPAWSTGVKSASINGAVISPPVEGGYLRIERDFKAGEKVKITFLTELFAEGRKFQRQRIEPGKISRLRDVALVLGPQVLFAPQEPAGRPTLLATVNAAGKLELLAREENDYISVALPGPDVNEAQIATALESAPPVLLHPWQYSSTNRRMAFLCDLVVLPKGSTALKGLTAFVDRARSAR